MKPGAQLYAPVFEGLIDPKHIQNLSPHPLFMYLDLLIKETRNHGRVRNGVPIADSDIAGRYGIDIRTVRRWRKTLLAGGYIEAERKAHGYAYTIRKSKKFSPKTVSSDRTKMSGLPDSVIGQICPITGVSDRTVESYHEPSDRTVESGNSSQPSDSRDSCASLIKEPKEVVVVPEPPQLLRDSQERMEKKISAVWEYYQDATRSDESISASAKAVIAKRLRLFKPEGDVQALTCAIDTAVHAAKTRGKKYMLRWASIFGKEDTFKSLAEECSQRDDIPNAAELAEEWL